MDGLAKKGEDASHFQLDLHQGDRTVFLRFGFEGVVYKYLIPTFVRSLAPCTFSKCVEAALPPSVSILG